MLEKEFKYYKDHQKEILKEHKDKYVVIVGETLIGSYGTMAEAFDTASKQFEPGTFFVKKCTQGDSAYTQRFYSRAVFV